MSGTDIREYIPDGRFLAWLNHPYKSESASQEYLDNITQHGCWCAKLDKNNPFKEFLGGPDTVDDLDEICKLWFQARNANDRLSGGFCRGEPWKEQISYSFSSQPNYSSSAHRDWGCSQMGGNPINTCAKAACEIDVYYMKQIREWMRAEYNSMYFPGDRVYSVVDNTTCTRVDPPENLRRKSSSLGHPFNKITSHFQQEVTDVPANAGFNDTKTYGNFSTYGYADNGLIISEDSNGNKIKVQLANEYSLKFMLKSDEGYGNWYHSYRSTTPRSIIYMGLEDSAYENPEAGYYAVNSGFPSIHFLAGNEAVVDWKQYPLAQNTSELPLGGTNYPTNTITPTTHPQTAMTELLDNDWHEIEYRTALVNTNGGTELNPYSSYTKYQLETYVDGVLQNTQYLDLNQANADGNQYAYIYASGHDDPNNNSLMKGIARVQIKDLTYTHLTSTPSIKWWDDSGSAEEQAEQQAAAEQADLLSDGWATVDTGNNNNGNEGNNDNTGVIPVDPACESTGASTTRVVFKLFYENGNWYNARDRCLALGNGASLAAIFSAEEAALVHDLGASTSAWIGGHDSISEGQWEWLVGRDGVPESICYDGWSGGEPNNSGNEDCTEKYTNGLWNDISCSSNRGAYICQIRW